MQALAISYKGMEDITALELKELTNAKTSIKESCVIFEIKDLEDLNNLSKKAQSINRLLVLLDNFKINKINDLTRISEIDLSSWLEDKTFAARCEIFENKKLDAREIEKTTGDQIEGKVNLDNPDITIFIYIYKDECYIGIDFYGDLSKRNYKIITSRFDLKGTIAYALVRLSGFDRTGILVDPFCATGTIVIEAALFANRSNKFNSGKTNIYGMDKRIRAAEQNSKAAGIRKCIHLDTADLNIFKENEISSIASNPPRFTKYSSKAKIWQEFNDFFCQAKIVLRKNGKIVLCSNKTDKLKETAQTAGFNLLEEREIRHGQETLKIVTFLKP